MQNDIQSSDMTPPAPSQPDVLPVSQQGVTGSRPAKGRKKLLFMAVGIVLAVLVALAGGYVFAFYIPGLPDNVYNSGLQNTGAAVDAVIAYSKTQQEANYNSAAFDGSLNFKSSAASFDIAMNGSSDKAGNATAKLDADVMGERATVNFRSLHVNGSASPDLYVQATGVKPFLDKIGLSSFDDLDGQWIAIDHTLLDTYASNLKQDAGGPVQDGVKAPSYEQLQDAVTKVQTVNKQYIFTTDPTKAVLTNQQFVAREVQSGQTTNHYKVGYNKDHLQSYIDALGTALDSSKLNAWSKQTSNKNLSDMLDIATFKNEAKQAKTGYTFDLWIDLDAKLVSKVALTDSSDSSSVFAISQNYGGGSTYPFGFSFVGKDNGGNPQSGTLNLTLDTATNKITAALSATTKGIDGTTTIDTKLHITPGSATVTATVPSGAKSVLDILNEHGLGGTGGLLSGMPL